MSLELKAAILGVVAGLAVLGGTFGLSPLFQPAKAIDLKQHNPSVKASLTTTTAPVGEANLGHNLFDRNCAHCHGDDARGDEGPNLYNLAKSDARITQIINGGIKGEMPSFAKKFSDADVHALIAYLRTLNDSGDPPPRNPS